MKLAWIAGAALAALAGSPAHALEPFVTYDNFTATGINPALWNDWERTRIIKKGQMELVQRSYGLATTDSGTSFYTFNSNLTDPTLVTEMRAKITVNALEVNACASNASVGQSRARLNASFFNAGTPVAGDQTNDVLAQVRILRLSNSADPAGVLQVQGVAIVCTNSDCTASTTIGSPASLGTVDVGTAATVQMQWDKLNNRFLFSRDAGAFSGTVSYTQSDAHPPGLPFSQLSTRTDIANCLSNPRVTGYVDASFDNVAVNKSAGP